MVLYWFNKIIVLKRAKEVVCNPNYVSANPNSPLVKILKEKEINYTKYYKDQTVRDKVDQEITKQLVIKRYMKWQNK